MNIESYAACVVGRQRKNNEDNVYLCGSYRRDTSDRDFFCAYNGPEPFLAAVCDGMGGEFGGEIASLEAVRTLCGYEKHFAERTEEYISRANAAVCALAGENAGRMGTTLCTVFIENGTAHVCNIGDSRAYLKRNGVLYQLSRDHTQAQQLCDHGVIGADEVKTHPQRHVLTQFIGVPQEEMLIEAAIAEPFEFGGDDVLLLCSDGLTDMLTDEDIYRELGAAFDAEGKAKALIERALSAGGKDNISVIVAMPEHNSAVKLLKKALGNLKTRMRGEADTWI